MKDAGGSGLRVTAESSAATSPEQPSPASGATPQGWHGPPGCLPRLRLVGPGGAPAVLGVPGAVPGGTSVGRRQRASNRPRVQREPRKECLEPLLNQVGWSRLHISRVSLACGVGCLGREFFRMLCSENGGWGQKVGVSRLGF